MDRGSHGQRPANLAKDKFLYAEGNLFCWYPIEDNQLLGTLIADALGVGRQAAAKTHRVGRGRGK